MINLPIWACIILLVGAAGMGCSMGLIVGCCFKVAGKYKPPTRTRSTCDYGRFGMRDNTARCGQCVRKMGAPGWERRND